MVVCLFAVVRAGPVLGAVVRGAVAHEAVLQRLVAFLVPLEVPHHLVLLEEDAEAALQTVEVLLVLQLMAVHPLTLLPTLIPATHTQHKTTSPVHPLTLLPTLIPATHTQHKTTGADPGFEKGGFYLVPKSDTGGATNTYL